MKKNILLLYVSLLLNTSVYAGNDCFIAKENNNIITSEGDCASRYAPCSTFKIALSLMGYNEGILLDETHPEWPYKEGYANFLESWKHPHTPQLWMKNSCVWYSQVLTEKLGMDKFKNYVKKFNYGNQDVSGDKGKNNGLSRAWLSSSLEISPEEQIIFLQKLIGNRLPVNKRSHEMTKAIMFIEELPGGWKLYGKTGMGNKLNADRTEKLDINFGWFIGWIEKGNRTITFVKFIEDDKKEEVYTSLRAKDAAKEKLIQIIQG
jgi:beta-lactamase class D